MQRYDAGDTALADRPRRPDHSPDVGLLRFALLRLAVDPTRS